MLNLDQIPNIESDRFSHFLTNKGWRLLNPDEGSRKLAVSPADDEGNRLTYIFPEDKDANYKVSLSKLLEGCSVVEGLNVEETVRELLEFDASTYLMDQATIKMKFGGSVSERMPLLAIENIAKNCRLALAHSIANEEKMNVFRPYTVPPSANIAAQKFEVGHTQRGSYIIVVKTPANEIQGSFLGEDRVLYTQTRSVLRLLKGVHWVCNNLEKTNNYEDVLSACGFGLNANMAKHLFELFSTSGATEQALVFGFSSEILKKEKINQVSFSIKGKELNAFNKVYELLSQPHEIKMKLSVKVIRLFSENPTEEDLVKKVTVSINLPGSPFNRKKMTFPLGLDLYNTATRKHIKGKYINIEGIFEVVGSKIELAELLRFDF